MVDIDFFSAPHTWNQKLLLHPHVHCVAPAGGLSPDQTHWIAARSGFFLPYNLAPSHQEASTLLLRPEVMAVGIPLTGSKNMSCCTQTLCFPCPPGSGARPCGVTYTI